MFIFNLIWAVLRNTHACNAMHTLKSMGGWTNWETDASEKILKNIILNARSTATCYMHKQTHTHARMCTQSLSFVFSNAYIYNKQSNQVRISNLSKCTDYYISDGRKHSNIRIYNNYNFSYSWQHYNVTIMMECSHHLIKKTNVKSSFNNTGYHYYY